MHNTNCVQYHAKKVTSYCTCNASQQLIKNHCEAVTKLGSERRSRDITKQFGHVIYIVYKHIYTVYMYMYMYTLATCCTGHFHHYLPPHQSMLTAPSPWPRPWDGVYHRNWNLAICPVEQQYVHFIGSMYTYTMYVPVCTRTYTYIHVQCTCTGCMYSTCTAYIVYMHTYACMYMHIPWVCMYMYVHTHPCTCMYSTCTAYIVYMYTYACMYRYTMYIHTHVRVCTCTSYIRTVYRYTLLYMYMYVIQYCWHGVCVCAFNYM